ncbi:MAG: polysaccharide biosynthesis/export family protein [bacterium]
MKKIGLIAAIALISLNTTISLPALSQVNEVQKADEYQIRTYNLHVSNKYNARKYFLGPNDILSIDVFGVEEFKQEDVKIQPDGKVLIRPFEPIKASGMTIDELQSYLTKKYDFYVKDPKVSIRLTESRPFIVYITGDVSTPGSYEITTDSKAGNYVTNAKPETHTDRRAPILTNVLVAAGGLKFDSDIEHIKIKNDLDGSEFEVNLLDMLDKSDTSQDIYLMPGDNVHIPKLPSPLSISEDKFKKFASATFCPKTIPIKVFGYVNNPGIIQLDVTQSLDLMSAISGAGGFSGGEGSRPNSGSPPKQIFISRTDENGKVATKTINPMKDNITILPNDIIYVPDKVAPKVGRAFDFVSRMINPFYVYSYTHNNFDYMFNGPKR